MRITFPTVLTLSRIVLIPFLVQTLINESWRLATGMFVFAAITDMLDGYLARRWNQESDFGACLDPVADKLLIIACYATLFFSPISDLPLPGWFLLVVLVKESALLVGAFYFGLLKGLVRIRPSLFGKATMVVQSCLVIWLLLCSIFDWVPMKTFHVFLAVAIFFVLGSLMQYAYQVFAAFLHQDDEDALW